MDDHRRGPRCLDLAVPRRYLPHILDRPLSPPENLPIDSQTGLRLNVSNAIQCNIDYALFDFGTRTFESSQLSSRRFYPVLNGQLRYRTADEACQVGKITMLLFTYT